MSDEKIFENEILSNKELSNVAGGYKWESIELLNLYNKAESLGLPYTNRDILYFLEAAGIEPHITCPYDTPPGGGIHVIHPDELRPNKGQNESQNEYYAHYVLGMNEKITHAQVIARLKEFYGI